MATPERVTLTDVRTAASEILSITRGNQPTEEVAHRHASTAMLFRRRVQAIDSQLEELDEETHGLREEMNKLRGRLRDVEQRRGGLNGEKAEFLQVILAIDSLVAPWRRLPRELMEEIFIHCLPYERDRHLSLKHAPFILTRVCRSWYQLVGDMPRMWSTIILAKSRCLDSLSAAALDAGIRYMGLCVARSKDSPITLCVRAEFLSKSRSRNLINQISPRIVTFKIVYPEPRRSTPSSFLSSSDTLVVPNLKTMEVQGWPRLLHNEGSHFVRIMESSKHLECFISNVCLNIMGTGPLTSLCWSKLQILHLRGSVSFRLCLSILQNTPTLHTLSLYWRSPMDGNYSILGSGSAIAGVDMASLFTHPNLRTLSIDYLNCLFNIVALPKLENLVLLGYEEERHWSQLRDSFMAFLARSGCELKYFELRGYTITPCQVLELVTSKFFRRTLETLIVGSDEEVTDSRLFESLTIPQHGAVPTSEDLDGASITCPNLQTLLLGFELHQDSIRSLVDMIESRSRDFMQDDVRGGGTAGRPSCQFDLVRKSLKIFGKISDWSRYENQELLSCCAGRDVALMVAKFWGLPQPAGEKQEALLRRRMAEGVELRFFDHVGGKWVSATGDVLEHW